VPAEPLRASIRIDAAPERVFEHFVQPEAMLRWMGDYAVLDARPGGEFTLDINSVPVRGRYLEIEPPSRLVISWGHAGSDLLPPGSSRLEVSLRPEAGGTLVEIVHSDLPDLEARKHAAGWRIFLGRLAIAAPGGVLEPFRSES
jgi:uncharacterized protein YndB with AHSA1/START domain